MANDDFENEDKPRKPARDASEHVESEAQARKRQPAPEDDDEEPLPRKRPRREDDDAPRTRRRDAEDEDAGASAMAAIVPVGTSVWALAAFYLGLLSCILGPLGLFAIFCGVMAFIYRPAKTSYGSVTGHMRAILGILFGLVGLGITVVLIIAFFQGAFK